MTTGNNGENASSAASSDMSAHEEYVHLTDALFAGGLFQPLVIREINSPCWLDLILRSILLERVSSFDPFKFDANEISRLHSAYRYRATIFFLLLFGTFIACKLELK